MSVFYYVVEYITNKYTSIHFYIIYHFMLKNLLNKCGIYDSKPQLDYIPHLIQNYSILYFHKYYKLPLAEYCPIANKTYFISKEGKKSVIKGFHKLGYMPCVSETYYNPKESKELHHSILEELGDYRSRLLYIYFDLKTLNFNIYFSYNPRLIELFDNRLGNLPSVTEYNPRTKARVTTDIELIHAVVEKASGVLGDNWSIVTNGLDIAARFNQRSNFVHQRPIKEIKHLFNKDQKLIPAQNQLVRKIIERKGAVINGSEVGSGKACMTLAYIAYCYTQNKSYKALVTCPKNVRDTTWTNEINKFFKKGVFRPFILTSENIKTKPNLDKYNIVITNYEVFRKWDVPKGYFDLCAFDESHKLKNSKADITRQALRKRHAFKTVMCISGTFTPNKKDEAFTQLNLVQAEYIRLDELRYTTLGGFWNKISSDIYVRINKSDLDIQLPRKITDIIEVNAPVKHFEWSNIGDLQRFRRYNAQAMIPSTLELLSSFMDTEDTILITSEFVDVIEKLYDTITNIFTRNLECPNIPKGVADSTIKYHGKLSDKKRKEAIKQFVSDKGCRIFLATRPSIAEGINELVKANRIIQNDLPWVTGQIEQVEGRIYRTGQNKICYSYWMVNRKSMASVLITNRLHDKYQVIQALNQGKQPDPKMLKALDEPINLLDILKQLKDKNANTKNIK